MIARNSSVPEILLVTHRVPFPPDKGDRIRTYHLLRYLSERFRVHLASFADEPVSDATAAELAKLTVRFECIPHGSTKWLGGLRSILTGGTISEGIFTDARMQKLLKSWNSQTKFRGVVLSASSLSKYLVKPGFDDAIRIVDSVDVDSQKWLDYAAASSFPKKWLYSIEGRRLRHTEISMAQRSDAVTFVSERESELVRTYCDPQKVITATNGVDLDYYRPQKCENPEGLVFVGALDYKPNVDGICWFVQEIWQRLRLQMPELKLNIVGRQPVSAVKALAKSPGVQVAGQVPDVRPFLAGAALVIAPLMIARGLQNKVLEAMAFGKPVIGSPAALAGFGHSKDLPAIACGTPDEWISQITTVLQDSSRLDKLSIEGRRYAESYHDWRECLSPFGRLLQSHRPCEQTGTCS